MPTPAHRRTPAAERQLVLAARGRQGSERDELVAAFLPLIGSVARTYRGSAGIDRRELMQEGVVGLLRALERFDPGRDTPFWAYASWWVRQAMQQLVSELARPVVLSDRAQRQLARVKDARRKRVSVNGREPTFDELVAESGLSERQVHHLVTAERRPRALDEPVAADDDAGATFGDLLADPRAEEAYEEVPSRVLLEELPRLLGELNDRERAIVLGHFGLDGQERTLRDLGEALGLSAERVRQIESAALDKLRAATASPAPRVRPRDAEAA
jgi:RNA polymerase sigma factor (sigma-70 family)